ncbi:unnamed protein product [Symbiodinium natans]|uniref:Uncharacterized protein n=1 Tax=Symbiodinium natans TaxID=878477 RepID=A0A812PV78_9DINO|nr:unnamed protein product [Symbiodinium natans]
MLEMCHHRETSLSAANCALQALPHLDILWCMPWTCDWERLAAPGAIGVSDSAHSDPTFPRRPGWHPFLRYLMPARATAGAARRQQLDTWGTTQAETIRDPKVRMRCSLICSP